MACALWVVGFDLAPLAHVALHAHLEAHDHGQGVRHAHRSANVARGCDHHAAEAHAASTVVRPRAASFAEWRDHGRAQTDVRKTAAERGQHHDHHALAHACADPVSAPAVARDPVAASAEASAEATREESPLEHGEGSLAHRDVAALLPLPGLPPVPAAPFAGWAPIATHDELSAKARPSRTRARGPPRDTDIHPLT